MMSKFMKQTRGAISIFLVIVLLPMMTLASVFVDSARIQLANSMAESAGDLTLNTALTNYDSEMKNLYGQEAQAKLKEMRLEKMKQLIAENPEKYADVFDYRKKKDEEEKIREEKKLEEQRQKLEKLKNDGLKVEKIDEEHELIELIEEI